MHFYTFLQHTCVIGDEKIGFFITFLMLLSVEEREVVFDGFFFGFTYLGGRSHDHGNC